MKKNLIVSYVHGITDLAHGESYGTILRYFAPEFISSFLLYTMPALIDAYIIGHLESMSAYSTLGATNSLLHFLLKISEAVSIGTVIMTGRHNGRADYVGAGRLMRDAFWVTMILGFSIASILFFGAHWIYAWYVPTEMIPLGVPFLRLRAIGVFLMFVFLAFIGFLRGIKDAVTPMRVFVLGTLTFVFFDYVLVFGKWGFPAMGLQGSALASVIQYLVMFCVVCVTVLFKKEYRRYGIHLFRGMTSRSQWRQLIHLSWPVLLDKATMAFGYIWLYKMIKPLGTCGAATFSVVKDMERVALVPGLAFAQIITFLVSNDFGAQHWDGIKSNIKKVLFLSSMMMMSVIILFAAYPHRIIQCFDRTGEFTVIASQVFPLLSVLVFFDLLQLILSGALRGAGSVRTVMYARLLVIMVYFVPVSFLISQLPIADVVQRLVLTYGSFYVGHILMSIVYINRFRGEEWKMVAKGS